MDGGSTDSTVDVLNRFGKRLRWVSQKDNGQSDAINSRLQPDRGRNPRLAQFRRHLCAGSVPGGGRVLCRASRRGPGCTAMQPTPTPAGSTSPIACTSSLTAGTACSAIQTSWFSRQRSSAAGHLRRSAGWMPRSIGRWITICGCGSSPREARWLICRGSWRISDGWRRTRPPPGGWGRLNEIVGILRRQGYGPPGVHPTRTVQHARPRRPCRPAARPTGCGR